MAEGKQNTSDLLHEWQQHGTFSESQLVAQEGDISIYCDASQPWVPRGRGVHWALSCRPLSISLRHRITWRYSYFRRTEARHQALQTLRLALRDRRHVATTLGYGPRYLHSTGQLHKGGPNTGVFILFTADAPADLAIPEQPYGFATLQRAQALGDFRSLNTKGRRVVRIHLGSDIEGSLKTLVDSLV